MNGKVVLYCLFALMTITAISAASGIPGIIVLNIRPDADKHGRQPVIFNHQLHENSTGDCVKCHHELSQSYSENDVNKCSTCHVEKKNDNCLSLKDAYHRMCITCHKKIQSTGKKVPLYCGECHKHGKSSGE